MTVTRLTGDALETVRTLPDSSVDLVACSPPFLALRNYRDLDGQWGSEPTPAAFLDNLLALTTELGRVLTPTGSIAIELGDTYSGSGGAGGDYSKGGMRDGQSKYRANVSHGKIRDHESGRRNHGPGWPRTKSLCGVPTLFAWSLAYGRNLLVPSHEVDRWLVRNVIAWARNNPAPGSLSDKVRPATSYITVATLNPKRWWDGDAIRQEASPNTHARAPKGVKRKPKTGKAIHDGRGGNWDTLDELGTTPNGAPPLDHWHDEYDGDMTWIVNTKGSALAHYAMWPAKLAERLVLAMCPPDGTVLDPFAGTGTTLAVADLHGRDAIGIDLDPANADLYDRRRVECERELFPGRPKVHPKQEALL